MQPGAEGGGGRGERVERREAIERVPMPEDEDKTGWQSGMGFDKQQGAPCSPLPIGTPSLQPKAIHQLFLKTNTCMSMGVYSCVCHICDTEARWPPRGSGTMVLAVCLGPHSPRNPES